MDSGYTGGDWRWESWSGGDVGRQSWCFDLNEVEGAMSGANAKSMRLTQAWPETDEGLRKS